MTQMCQFEPGFKDGQLQCVCSVCGQVVRTDNNCERVYCQCGGARRPVPPRVIPPYSETVKRTERRKEHMAADLQRQESVEQYWREHPPHPTVSRNVVKDVMRWGAEMARWTAAGKPERTEEEQTYIHDLICQPCPYYRKGKCSNCGCGLRKQPWLKDKISMATTGCPLGRWGARSKRLNCRWVVGVLTAPRKEERLTASLKAISEAGWNRVHVFAEPNSPRPQVRMKLIWHQNETRLDGMPNFTHAMSTLVTQDEKAEAVLIFQDDIDIARRARSYVERRLLWPEPGPEKIGVISMYTSTNQHKVNTQGLTEHERGGFYGALGWIFPWHAAHTFLRVQKEKKIVRGAIDVCVSRVLQAEGLRLFHHQPSLIQHTGNTSVMHPGSRMSPSRKAIDDWCKDAGALM